MAIPTKFSLPSPSLCSQGRRGIGDHLLPSLSHRLHTFSPLPRVFWCLWLSSFAFSMHSLDLPCIFPSTICPPCSYESRGGGGLGTLRSGYVLGSVFPARGKGERATHLCVKCVKLAGDTKMIDRRTVLWVCLLFLICRITCMYWEPGDPFLFCPHLGVWFWEAGHCFHIALTGFLERH